MEWVSGLREAGLTLEVDVLDFCERHTVGSRERHWIAWFREGWDLYNIEAGGRARLPKPEIVSKKKQKRGKRGRQKPRRLSKQERAMRIAELRRASAERCAENCRLAPEDIQAALATQEATRQRLKTEAAEKLARAAKRVI